jgi:3-methyladenine DNA glycosylase AlkD
LGYKDKTDVDVLKNHIEVNLGSTEFFINKAIGWALREYGKTNPEWVMKYLDSLEDRLHPLSKREALKNLQ